jgi:hypothetical protein
VNRPTPGYDRAVWSRVWSELKAWRSKLFLKAIETVILFAASYWVLSNFGSKWSDLNFTLDKLLAVPLALILTMLVHLLWTWGTAPRQLYKKRI